MRKPQSQPTGRIVETRRAGRVYIAEAGSGEPVMLLHGISSSSEAFRRQLEGLADAYRLIAWDAPGYASSEDPPASLDMDGYAAAATEVMSVLGVETAHVVGVSWGGVIATRIALRYAERVISLSLVGSTPGRGASPGAANDLKKRSEGIAREGVAEYARARAPFVLAPGSSESLVEEVRRRIVESVRLPGYRYAAESLARTDHRPKLSEIAAPTLVMVGEHDNVTGPEDSRELVRLIPGSGGAGRGLMVIPGAGHLANQEEPDIVNGELRRHWEKFAARLGGVN